jgi:hypothetical protein
MTQKTYLIILFLVLICNPVVKAQNAYPELGTNLEDLFNRMAMSEIDTEKGILNDSIIILIQQYINTDSVFYHRFNNIKFLGQITSPDSLVKILTWNVAFSDGVQNYYCYLLSKSFIKDETRWYKLTGISGTDEIRKDTTYSQNDWYGSLYYDIRPFTINNEKYYILLGIDFKNAFLTRKVIEIVQLSDENKLVFGKLCFIDTDRLNYREVFNYSGRASMTLRFDSEDKVVFDHLSPFSPEYKDNFQYYGPDFSYDAYVLEGEQWKLKQDIDVRNK